ncbi:MAG: hypothetical protein U9R79_20460 [Armatimonadota bacterium]|nr:hypothetical protein [Armatimonadota bacterium]
MKSARREFLRSILRGGVGALLVGGTGWLALRSGEPCWSDGGCRRCPELRGCELPEARIARMQRGIPEPADQPPTGEGPAS